MDESQQLSCRTRTSGPRWSSATRRGASSCAVVQRAAPPPVVGVCADCDRHAGGGGTSGTAPQVPPAQGLPGCSRLVRLRSHRAAVRAQGARAGSTPTTGGTRRWGRARSPRADPRAPALQSVQDQARFAWLCKARSKWTHSVQEVVAGPHALLEVAERGQPTLKAVSRPSWHLTCFSKQSCTAGPASTQVLWPGGGASTLPLQPSKATRASAPLQPTVRPALPRRWLPPRARLPQSRACPAAVSPRLILAWPTPWALAPPGPGPPGRDQAPAARQLDRARFAARRPAAPRAGPGPAPPVWAAAASGQLAPASPVQKLSVSLGGLSASPPAPTTSLPRHSGPAACSPGAETGSRREAAGSAAACGPAQAHHLWSWSQARWQAAAPRRAVLHVQALPSLHPAPMEFRSASTAKIAAGVISLLAVALVVMAYAGRHTGLGGQQLGLDFSRRMLQGAPTGRAPCTREMSCLCAHSLAPACPWVQRRALPG